MKTSALASAAQQRADSHDPKHGAGTNIADELARIDRGLHELMLALEPLRGDRAKSATVARFLPEMPTASFALPALPSFPAPDAALDTESPSYGSAPPAAYSGAPAAAHNTVAVYGSAPTVAPAPLPEPSPDPRTVAQAVAAPGASPVLAAIALLHPTSPTEQAGESIELPVLDSVRPRSHGETGWIGSAIRRLSNQRPDLAGRAIIALLPMQGDVITDEVSYDLVVTGELCHAVTVEQDETSIHRVTVPRPLASIDARIEARIEALGAVPFRAPIRTLRKSDAFRIHGRARKKALAALKALAIAPVTLAEVRAAGVKLSDELILAVIGAGIAPEWTIGHRFTIAVKIEDASGDEPHELFVRVNDGAAVSLSRGLPLDLPSATLSCTSEELANVLLGQSVGRHATLAGERAPVMLLQGWVARLESGRG